MEFESVCDALRENIATVLLATERPSRRVTFIAARATSEIADALYHAAGIPDDPRWSRALGSLEQFVDACGASPRVRKSPAFASLRNFIAEN